MNFTEWEIHFSNNQSHFRDIDFSAPDNFTEAEKRLTKSSLQQFQRGEHSEGKHLFAFARKVEDPAYLRCISLFIREEQTHARVLAKFMEKHGIARIRHHWVDGIFRWLRKIAGIENTVRVLLTAEIISKVYYAGLHNATNSVLLKRICRQILNDEDYHISFQCDTLNPFYHRKSWLAKFFVRLWHFTLMSGTIVIVWLHHRRVLKRGGYNFAGFFRVTIKLFFACESAIRKKVPSIGPAKEMLPV
jgi:hypothetical protein